uniref:FBD domain-containing protein n=2 Tax=Lotus japonicus TaxID=34305 RepID=I3S3Z9_LOTJA|nr:unknown [Lotus japonicus]
MRLRDIFYDDVDAIVHYKNFKSLSKLVRADIHSVLFDIFVESPKFDKYLDDILLFPNLTHVELMFGLWMSWDFVLAMLKHSPMLQYVVLSMQIQNGFYQYPVWISPCFAPECLSSQLRKCSIINYAGRESELHFAKYIMQNSKVLRTMTVCTLRYSELKVEDKLELLKELSLCPRSSSICELSFT